ncbi:hypothetical protein [Sporosarcina sp. BP05]|uniref:hypothetical protein n=1 Tax=Sporosarcina sp. BP05 TaxID=2758726 RepID=UPI001648016B|nr:hypothetical protein [Sporosarcina sp. BP05]
MKNSTRKVIESLPVLQSHLINEGSVKFKSEEIEGLNQIEKTFLQLVNFFEEPEENKFQLQELYKNLSDDWLVLALDSINVFFEKDTYLIQNKKAHSLTGDGENYLNQKQFVDFLNEKGQNYSEAKLSVYIQRDKMPLPDLVISDTKYWLKDTCEKFADKLETPKQKGGES